MASAIIDRAALVRLVAAAIGSITGVTFVPSRREDPSTLSAWCRIASIALRREARVMQGVGGPDEKECADVTVTVEVGVGQGLENAYAFESAAMRVLAVLHEVRLAAAAIDPDATHEMLLACTQEPDVMVDNDRKIEVGVLVFEGIAERATGTSMLDFVN